MSFDFSNEVLSLHDIRSALMDYADAIKAHQKVPGYRIDTNQMEKATVAMADLAAHMTGKVVETVEADWLNGIGNRYFYQP